jgi:hypothetical protein
MLEMQVQLVIQEMQDLEQQAEVQEMQEMLVL